MLNWIFKFFSWIYNIWKDLSEETKEKIIDAIVTVFEDIFRKYYRDYKNSK
jgi:hypothetical protein